MRGERIAENQSGIPVCGVINAKAAGIDMLLMQGLIQARAVLFAGSYLEKCNMVGD